jgi:sugar (pentulose or hexulose) kinase
LSQPTDAVIIATLVVGPTRADAALVHVSGEVLWEAGVALPTPTQWGGFVAQPLSVIREAVMGLCAGLGAARGGKALLAMAMATPAQTAVLIGSENALLSPVLFGEAAPTSARAVAADFMGDEAAERVFRRSPIRQGAQWVHDLPLMLRRVASLDSALCHMMTRQWVATAACPPTGLPYDAQRMGVIENPGLWLAAGIHPSAAPLLTPPGGVQAQLDPGFAQRVGLPAHCPLLSVGSDMGALAVGLDAHPRRWAVALDGGVSAAWGGPAPAPALERWWMPRAPSTVSFQVLEDGFEQLEEPVDPHLPAEAARLAQALGDGFDWLPGAGPQQATFCASAAQGLAYGEAWRQALAQDMEGVPAGGDGLRVLPGRTTSTLIGVMANHAAPALGRALVEGLALEVHRWAEVAFEDGPAQPIRLALGDGWPRATAQRFADILGGPVFAYDAAQAARARLLGLALGALRGLGFSACVDAPPPSWVATPGPQAALYDPHRALHGALMGVAHPLLR